MRIKLAGLLGTLLIVVGLNGCATQQMTGKSADEVGKAAMARMMDESSYNFEGSGQFTKMDLTDTADSDQYAEIMKAFSFDMSGALDQAQKRMEFTPVVRFEHRNLQASIKFPMLIDNKGKTRVLVDAAAASLFLKGLKPYDGKYIQLPDEYTALMGDPFDKSQNEKIRKIQAGIDAKAFSFQPVSDLGKKWGASTNVRVVLDKKELSSLMCQVTMLRMSAALRGEDAANDASCEKFDAILGADDSQTSVNLDMGLDRQGRIVSMQIGVNLTEGDKPFMAGVFSFRLFNFGHPKFSLNPTDAEIGVLDKNMSLSQLLTGEKDDARDKYEDVAPAKAVKKSKAKRKSAKKH